MGFDPTSMTGPYLIPLTQTAIHELQHDILGVYYAAFSLPPYTKTWQDTANFANAFAHHRQRPGFRFLAAIDPALKNGLAGFVYGYTSRPGQWWHDLVAKELPASAAETWLGDAFEFVELAVRPDAQGQGLGSRLHDGILEGLPHRTSVLSTLAEETAGLRLYQRRGWQTLLNPFWFSTTPLAYRIMGKVLRGEEGI